MTPDEAYQSLAWLTADDAWSPVDAALWAICNTHGIEPTVRDMMNREIRYNLRAHGAHLASDPSVRCSRCQVLMPREGNENVCPSCGRRSSIPPSDTQVQS